MLRFGCLALFLSLMLVRPVWAEQDAPPDDLLTLAKGAVLVAAPADFNRALALTDGDAASNWNASTKKVPPPYSFVFELISPANLTHVGLVGAGERPGGVVGGSAKIVRVEGSNTGPDGGYTAIATLIAAPDGPTLAEVTQPGPYRWLRFTVQAAHSDTAAWIYLNEVLAYGEVTAPQDTARFTGVFQTGRKDTLELTQDGTAVTGCYVENSGLSTGTITGAVQDGVALVSWTSDQGITGSGFRNRPIVTAAVGS